jgi:hypothetical protein
MSKVFQTSPSITAGGGYPCACPVGAGAADDEVLPFSSLDISTTRHVARRRLSAEVMTPTTA